MTDNDKNKQREDSALSNVFKRLQDEDNISPSAELDALILKQAAAAIAGDTESVSTGTTSTETKDKAPIDIKFRRQQLNKERERQRRKKPFLPIWAMPMGLAAAVLVSFGVVTRVMQSPEFMQPAGTEYMTEVQTSDAPAASYNEPVKSESLRDANKDSLGLTEELGAEISEDIAASTPQVKQNTEDLTFSVNKEKQSRQAEMKARLKKKETASSRAAERVLSNSGERAIRQETVQADNSAKPPVPAEPRSVMSAPIAQSGSIEPAIEFATENTASANFESDVASDDSVEEMIFAEAESIAPEINVAADSNGLDNDSTDEVVVTGARIAKVDTDLSNYADTSKISIKEAIAFEHRACQIDSDCSLVVRDCDTCECVETINMQSADFYESELSDNHIKGQCLDTKAECIRNYCQVVEKDN